jgi:hypothetical protein
MKWNEAWLSNKDCDDDGKLDRHYGFSSYRGSGAWLTNHQSGWYEDYDSKGRLKMYHWSNFVKIVAAPSDAHVGDENNGEDPTKWYESDGTEIGSIIWGQFAIIQEIYTDPNEGYHGKLYKSPAGPGFGIYGAEG